MKVYKKPKTTKTFKQYLGAWASLPYPELPSTMASAGCGCVSVTHCALELDPTLNPSKTQPYMKNFAVKGHGTEWKGIDEGLGHFGLKDVKRHTTLSSLYKELAKGNRVAVFLFNSNVPPNGKIWTSGGHYVAAVGYKVGKKHWFYMKDSGSRHSTGWWSYEYAMKGAVKMLWSARVPITIILPEKGYFEYGDKSPEIKKIQSFLKSKGLYKGIVGGKIGKLTKKAIIKWQRENGLDPDGKFGPECLKTYLKQI